MNFAEIIGKIEEIAPPGLASSWDRSGLQVAAHGQDIKKLALCLDPTPSNLLIAAGLGAQFVLTHHPLFLTPLPLNENNLMVDALRILFHHDIWLYSAHTSLDQSFNSQVNWLAKELGLIDCRVLDVQPGAHETYAAAGLADQYGDIGTGLVGDLKTPLNYKEFMALLSKATGMTYCTLCGRKPAVVSRAAYCPGSGGSLVYKALESGAQIFITGDVKYHAALDLGSTLEGFQHVGPHGEVLPGKNLSGDRLPGSVGEKREFCVLDLGHFSLEEEMMRRWSFDLDAVLSGVEVFFVASSDPLRHEVL